MGVESGNGRGVWKRAWSLETGMESGNGRGVWKPPWSLETGVESGNHLGVWKPLWSLETTLESGNRLGVWKPPSKNVGQILLTWRNQGWLEMEGATVEGAPKGLIGKSA
jgi:hypothetical protein